ncbi:hypothetical protein [Prescottella subtropica]|uniref:hypothetical protein n=1 Tax=Prescottella subtropica TaxID=2545757 RepID=UPI0010F7C509|nr:hypothetical protein [Prescottella subtropica]
MSAHDIPRRRLSARQITALLVVATVAVTAVALWFVLGKGDAAPVAEQQATEQPADNGDAAALAKARSNLSQASLPLSLLGGGVDQLVDGGRQLDDGANQLSAGIGQARDGAQQLSDGLNSLSGGVGLLGDGAGQVSGGVDQVVDRLGAVGGMQADVTSSLRQVAGTLTISPDPVSQGAASRLTGLADRLDNEALGPDTLAQLATLKDGARQLSFELNDPSAQFVSGVNQIAAGAGQLTEGLGLLDAGGKALAAGTGQLVDGTGPIPGVVKGLSSSVNDASKALPSGKPATSGEATDTQAAAVPDTSGRPAWVYAVAGGGAALVGALVWGAFALGRRSSDRIAVTD